MVFKKNIMLKLFILLKFFLLLGGCAYQYTNGHNLDIEDIKIYVNPKASLFLIGTQMDYQEGELESGFKFINPNEKGRCGCGESFHV